jgi:hypothetical protein
MQGESLRCNQIKGCRWSVSRRPSFQRKAANPTEGLQFCEVYNQAIDRLITGVVKPGMSGRQFVELAVHYRPSLKGIAHADYTGEVISHLVF